jgi:hypothetical protein
MTNHKTHSCTPFAMRVVASSMGILTETDLEEEAKLIKGSPPKDWSFKLEHAVSTYKKAAMPLNSCSNTTPKEDCSHHGVCIKGRCVCVVAFAGKYCGHPVVVSPPVISQSTAALAALGWEGDFVLHQQMRNLRMNEWRSANENNLPVNDSLFKVWMAF